MYYWYYYTIRLQKLKLCVCGCRANNCTREKESHEEIDDGKEPRVLGYIFLGNRACQVNTPSPLESEPCIYKKR